MQPEKLRNFDKKVSPNWKPPAGLADRKPGMMWSDRIWYWLVALSGIGIIGVGVAAFFFLHLGRIGGWLIGIGFVVFVFGLFPSQAARNGYRSM
jgi:hypothetical protein